MTSDALAPRLMSHAAAAERDGSRVFSRLAMIGQPEPIGALLQRNASRFGDLPAYSERRAGAFEPTIWRKLCDDAVSFGLFLSACGVRPGDRVAVVSPNRGEMLVAEFATMCLGAVYVPIFAGYAPEQTSELLRRTSPTAVLLPNVSWCSRVEVPSTTRAVVTFDDTELGVRLLPSSQPWTSFTGALARGSAASHAPRRRFLDRAARLDPTLPCLMMFTSGTSGALKGVLLTHDNILSQRRALAAMWSITPDDRFLSYLPWHHSFGGIFEKYTALYFGATLCIDDSLGKDFDALLRNWKAVQPTVYFSVPKVYQQLVTHVQTHPTDESLVFHPRLRFVFTAAAPLPQNLSEFFAGKRIPVVEGWGLTETAPCCTLTDLAEPRNVPGVVGYPIPGVEVKVASDGEILVRGPNVMTGYFEDPAASHKALPGDGWFHTGDLGEFLGARLKLIARKDRVFKMLNAEKVVPTAIENRLAGMNKYIRHVIVTGSGQDFLTALVFPDFFRIAEEFGADRARADQVVKASLIDSMREFNRTHPVKYEHIQALVVVSRELAIETNELTPSLKMRVSYVLAGSADYLDAVYQPTAACECRFLRKVMRLAGDARPCFGGLDRTLDRCHECGTFIFDDAPSASTSAAAQ